MIFKRRCVAFGAARGRRDETSGGAGVWSRVRRGISVTMLVVAQGWRLGSCYAVARRSRWWRRGVVSGAARYKRDNDVGGAWVASRELLCSGTTKLVVTRGCCLGGRGVVGGGGGVGFWGGAGVLSQELSLGCELH